MSISLLNKGKKWLHEEDYQLKQEYTSQELKIVDIAKAHQRTVCSIICRLKSIEVLSPFLKQEEYHSIRGYNEYLQDLEFLKIEKESRQKKEFCSILNTKSKNTNTNIEEMNIDIEDMKKDIKEIKKDIKEILNFLHSIYEFEQEE